ncbi:ABC transporter substrate-binding protein [Microvirga roseola]|uniref:ABC transporter substrate-binding protein n=1 Tax=Microvirga roseola TaxID=2883126 RepID=UPI001E45217D|nr:ABC transporter substrate-binding protein [Microvirga roseola]
MPLVLTLWLGGGLAVAQPKPQRVVSLNLCADQLLLALADREQIASLSFLSRDPSLSFLAEEAAALPVNEGRAEAVLFGGADLVLAGTYGQQHQAALLQAQGLDVLRLGPWTRLEQGREQIRALARRLGHPERGEALIARIDAALARTKDIVPSRSSILIYDRRGWVPSLDSMQNEILAHMGFVPHQKALGLMQGGTVSMEALLTSPPDYMLVDEGSSQAVDQGSALFVHPALVKTVPLERRLKVPARLTICGGPSTPAMIEALAAEVALKVR